MKSVILPMVFLSIIATAVSLPAQGPDATVLKREPKIQTPSDQLEAEHRLILLVADAAEKEAAAIRKQESPDLKRVRQMTDFFMNFVDKCHYAKEERFYFPAVVYHDSTVVDALVWQLEAEHAFARSVIEELNFVFDYDDRDIDFISERLDVLATLFETHIRKENERLFPKADVYVTGAEERAILVGFRKIEEVDLGPGFHEKYRELAAELAKAPEKTE